MTFYLSLLGMLKHKSGYASPCDKPESDRNRLGLQNSDVQNQFKQGLMGLRFERFMEMTSSSILESSDHVQQVTSFFSQYP